MILALAAVWVHDDFWVLVLCFIQLGVTLLRSPANTHAIYQKEAPQERRPAGQD
jgi:hypothetical protein